MPHCLNCTAAPSPGICLHIAGDLAQPQGSGQWEEEGSGTVFSSVSLTPWQFHPGQLETGRDQREEAQISHSSQPHRGWSRSIREMKNKLRSGERLIGR